MNRAIVEARINRMTIWSWVMQVPEYRRQAQASVASNSVITSYSIHYTNLYDFANGTRKKSKMMTKQGKKLSPQDVEDLAAYYAKLKP